MYCWNLTRVLISEVSSLLSKGEGVLSAVVSEQLISLAEVATETVY